jgi:hypothetical protein
VTSFIKSTILYSSVHVSSDNSSDNNILLPSSIYDERAIDDDDDDKVGIHADFDHWNKGVNDLNLNLNAHEWKVKIKSEQVNHSPLTAANCHYSSELQVKTKPMKPEDELAVLNDLAAASIWTSAL